MFNKWIKPALIAALSAIGLIVFVVTVYYLLEEVDPPLTPPPAERIYITETDLSGLTDEPLSNG